MIVQEECDTICAYVCNQSLCPLYASSSQWPLWQTTAMTTENNTGHGWPAPLVFSYPLCRLISCKYLGRRRLLVVTTLPSYIATDLREAIVFPYSDSPSFLATLVTSKDPSHRNLDFRSIQEQAALAGLAVSRGAETFATVDILLRFRTRMAHLI